ncbi:hypothetical protein FCV43_19785 [Vibrio genomosp. F6]|uniref:hypothetical protein n=1 Tax=Vibrio TaxID=662 RepID=UPI0010BDED94|nr:hypothetical protein [Vibrio genomosp. F6]TKF14044.1 hypothetical protein FCV43_19785 [Vibrio genomosp. F6]
MTPNIKLLDSDYDHVIQSQLLSVKADYQFVLDKLVPAVDRLDIQRNKQNTKFYDRLATDIENGCVMPPLTLAIVVDTANDGKLNNAQAMEVLEDHLDEFFVLDGIQRVTTLQKVHKTLGEEFPFGNSIYLNVLVCRSFDLLLYRMITLNNGQKPMTARHQIEIIANGIYDFDKHDINVAVEKKNGKKNIKGSFKKSDLINAYLAFLSKSVNIDNNKVIEQKMDEIIARKIIESDLTQEDGDFDTVLHVISDLCENDDVKKWFLVTNNLIGFCVGARSNLNNVSKITKSLMLEYVDLFEQSFSYINPSKVKIGVVRRQCAAHLFSKVSEEFSLDEYDLVDEFSLVI